MKKTIIVILSVLSGSLAGLLVGELLVRICLPSYAFNKMFCVYSEKNQGSKYRPSALFGYELIPHSSADGREMINSFGMRDKEYSLGKPGETFRILLLGDSITERGKWSEDVENRLNKTGKYEILNCGVSGWGLSNYRAYLRHKGLNFDPDLVIVAFCLNDLTGYNVNATLLCDKKTGRGEYVYIDNKKYDTRLLLHMNTPLFRHSALYRVFLSRLIYRSLQTRDDRDLDALREMKMLTNGKILGIIYPYLKPLGEYSKPESNDYSDLKKRLNEASISYLDLTSYFNSFGQAIYTFRDKRDDKIHYNETGNRIKARIIYPWLVARIKEFRRNGGRVHLTPSS